MRMYAVDFFKCGHRVHREIVTARSEYEAVIEADRRGRVPYDVDHAEASVL